MKMIIESKEDTFFMSKLVARKADISRTGVIHDYIYFSECNDSCDPRIKFYGGTIQTKGIRNAPSMSFGVNTEPKVMLQHWMNPENCPRAFDDKVIEDLKQFIRKNKPILLLVWFGKLDETDALDYFQGYMEWEELISCILWNNEILEYSCSTTEELHYICLKENMYILEN